MSKWMNWLKAIEGFAIKAHEILKDADSVYKLERMRTAKEMDAFYAIFSKEIRGAIEKTRFAWHQARRLWMRSTVIRREYGIDIEKESEKLAASLEATEKHIKKDAEKVAIVFTGETTMPLRLREELFVKPYNELGVAIKVVREIIAKLKKAEKKVAAHAA